MKIMQAQARCHQMRNSYHDVLEADSCVTLAKADIGETPTVRQQVQLQPGCRVPAVLEKANEVIGVQVGSPPVSPRLFAVGGSRLTTRLARSNSQVSSRVFGGWEHIRQ